MIEPFVQDADFTLLCCDVLDGLRSLPDGSVHCVVTSSPYWGLRDYGADGQIGLEETPDLYVARMVEVFQEVRRVLRDDGTCWLNLGDSYSHGGNGSRDPKRWPKQSRNDHRVEHRNITGGKPKDLVGIPWRVAFALQTDGWYLRSDIIWSKPNPMPESVTDRPTKAHEYVFLLSKQPRYFFDQEAVREPAEWSRWGDQTVGKGSNPDGWIKPKTKQELLGKRTYDGFNGRWDESVANGSAPTGRNVRSVWEIATQPYPEAHFATYPEELVRRCVLAGTSERGCCPACGKPWERETDTTYEKSPVHGAGSVVGRHYETGANNFDGAGMPRLNKRVETTGWRPGCNCPCPDCGLPYVHDVDMRELPTAVYEEAQSPEVLQSALRESSGSGETSETLNDDERLRLAVHAGTSGGVEAGTSHGTPRGDGEGTGQVPATGRDRASQEWEEGRQSRGESGSDAEAIARSDAEKAATVDSLPALRRADSGAESAQRYCRCESAPPVVACVVLDPFLGSGTTAHVARKHGRRSIGIELNPAYCDLAARRMQQQSLFAQETS